MPLSEVKNIDCLEGMKGYPDNASYQRHLYQLRKDDPDFRKKKAESARKSYQKNKVKCLERSSAYRKRNLEKYNTYRNNYRKTNPSGIFDIIKQGATRRGLPFHMNRKEFSEWYNAQVRICTYCKRDECDVIKDVDIIQTRAHRLTIDRLNNHSGYGVDNLCLCCRRCNTIKGNFFSHSEMLEVGLIIQKRYGKI